MFFGDLNAIDAATGEKLWSQDLGESAAAYRERPAKSRRGGRLYNARMAHEDRAGLEGASASHRRETLEPGPRRIGGGVITHYRERRAKSRRGERLYNARVADRAGIEGARAELR